MNLRERERRPQIHRKPGEQISRTALPISSALAPQPLTPHNCTANPTSQNGNEYLMKPRR